MEFEYSRIPLFPVSTPLWGIHTTYITITGGLDGEFRLDANGDPLASLPTFIYLAHGIWGIPSQRTNHHHEPTVGIGSSDVDLEFNNFLPRPNDAHDMARRWLGRDLPLQIDWRGRGVPRAGSLDVV